MRLSGAHNHAYSQTAQLHAELHYRSSFDVWKLRGWKNADLPSEAKAWQTSVTRLRVPEAGNWTTVNQEILVHTLNMLSTYYIQREHEGHWIAV